MNKEEAMSSKDELKKRMKDKAAESAAKTDALLENELRALRDATKTDLEALRPKISDQEAYKKLIDIVDQSTRANENIGQLQERIEQAGSQVVKIAKKVYGLLA
jgi:galactokinase